MEFLLFAGFIIGVLMNVTVFCYAKGLFLSPHWLPCKVSYLVWAAIQSQGIIVCLSALGLLIRQGSSAAYLTVNLALLLTLISAIPLRSFIRQTAKKEQLMSAYSCWPHEYRFLLVRRGIINHSQACGCDR